LEGKNKTVNVENFPNAGQTTTLAWQESSQNFTVMGVDGETIAACTTRSVVLQNLLGNKVTLTIENPCDAGGHLFWRFAAHADNDGGIFLCGDVVITQGNVQFEEV
jgi:hypothetical protein